MREQLKTIVLQDRKALMAQLKAAGYAFAVWKLPEDDEIQFIISLDTPIKTEGPLKALDSGFLINRYADNHPAEPYLLKADIHLSKQNEVTLDPRVSSEAFDMLMQKLSTAVSTVTDTHKGTAKEPRHDFEQQVQHAVDAIRKGQFEKVVLSRYRESEIPSNFDAWQFYQDICDAYPNAFCSMVYLPDQGLWIGATPELLIADDAERFKTVALAGTKRLEEGQTLGEVAWTQKEIEEQAFVSRYVINCFKKLRLREFHEHGPKTIKAGHLAHLKTDFEVIYREVPFEGLADQMLDLLHPTSAVCGMPIAATKPWIKEAEQYDREFYAGFLGPVNMNQSTNLFVNLRCMKFQHNVMRFYAGAGITEDSNPEKEFQETEMKMNVLSSFFTK